MGEISLGYGGKIWEAICPLGKQGKQSKLLFFAAVSLRKMLFINFIIYYYI